MSVQADVFQKYVEKIKSISDQEKRRPLKSYGAIASHFHHYSALIQAFMCEDASKNQFIGMLGSFSNLSKEQSALGLFTSGFKKASSSIARGVAKLTQMKLTEGHLELLTLWIEFTALLTVGALELAKSQDSQKNDPFFDEMTLLLLFETKFPERYLNKMGEALGIDKTKMTTFIALVTLISLSSALLASDIDSLMESRVDWLDKNIGILISALSLSLDPLQADFEEIRISLKKGNLTQVRKNLQELLNLVDYDLNSLQEDLQEIKNLFLRLNKAYLASKEAPRNQVHMIG